MTRRGALALLLVLSLAGCYSYVPVTRQTLTPSAEVRVRLSLQYRAELRSILGTEPTTLEGVIVDTDGSDLLLETITAGIAYGVRARAFIQQVRVPWDQILEVEAKRLDPARTTGVVIMGATTAAAALYYLFGLAVGGTPGEGPNDGDWILLPPLRHIH